ncbi:MAG: acyltransferase [Proteobacteria bacterium]|nr:acyltransferase [Desulfobulbaceae bacterium]MBU4151255.1 acyltransferase [Pseudomonadota bacterium]
MIDHDSSRRIKLLRFPPIIGILYIHAYNTTIAFAGVTLGRSDTNAVTNFIRVLISQCLARIAVPIFFLLAGYLFFTYFKWSRQVYLHKLRTRFRSLFIPFFLWNLVVLTIVVLSQTLPAVQPYFPEGAPLAATHNAFSYLDAMLGLTRYPIAYHMWFIRDLIFLALLAPVIVVVLRFAALPFFGVMYLCWVTESWPVIAPGAVGVLFFSGGAFLGIKGKSLFALDRFGPLALFASLPIMVADTIWNSAWFNIYLHRTGLIIEVVATLYATKLVARHEGLSNFIITLGGTSFFVYAAHEPLLGIVRTLAYQYVPLTGPYTMLLLYLVIPLMVVVALVLLHRGLATICPQALNLITGGR